MIKFPAFNEENTKIVNVNRKANIYKAFGVNSESFEKYCVLFSDSGYSLKEQSDNGVYKYAAFFKDNEGIFVNFFNRTNELYFVSESDCKYFSFADNPLNNCVEPQITQLYQEDYGMTYVVRLSDGRFIVIDGGSGFETEVDSLMSFLKENSPYKTPVIAAWILTHEHFDHYLGYIYFDKKYHGQYKVESFILNFMEIDDERFPDPESTDMRRDINTSRMVNVPLIFEKIKESGAEAYMAHTGQIYNIGDCKIELLSSLDETVDFMAANINCTSLVFKMELGGQTILWTGDSTFSEARLPQRYGEYLKTDILQVPHHGFEGPLTDVEVLGYRLNSAHTAFLPVSEFNAYTAIDTYRLGPRYLFEFSEDIIDIMVGEENQTITLPYIPERYKRLEFKEKFCEGVARAGAKTWVFTNLFIENEEDVTFNILNMCSKTAVIGVEMFFLDGSKNLADIKIKVDKSLKKVNLTDRESIITDSVYFSWMSPDIKGFAKSGEFAVRFISNVPVAISNKNKQATYFG